MPFISDATLSSLRQLHTTAMMDECELLAHLSGGTDEYNMPEPETYHVAATLPCSFRPLAPGEGMSKTETSLINAEIAFDHNIEAHHGLSIRGLDRIRLTKLHGEILDRPQLYDINGPIRRDNVAVVVSLKRVTDEGQSYG